MTTHCLRFNFTKSFIAMVAETMVITGAAAAQIHRKMWNKN
jgi:hypothetical protein